MTTRPARADARRGADLPPALSRVEPHDLAFFVPGVPRPKGRPRVVRCADGRVRGVTPAATRAWERTIQAHAVAATCRWRWKPVAGAYEVDLEVHGASVQSDLDNHAKAVLDAGNTVLWPDDRCVVRLLVDRVDVGELVGVRVTVRRRDP